MKLRHLPQLHFLIALPLLVLQQLDLDFKLTVLQQGLLVVLQLSLIGSEITSCLPFLHSGLSEASGPGQHHHLESSPHFLLMLEGGILPVLEPRP